MDACPLKLIFSPRTLRGVCLEAWELWAQILRNDVPPNFQVGRWWWQWWQWGRWWSPWLAGLVLALRAMTLRGRVNYGAREG